MRRPNATDEAAECWTCNDSRLARAEPVRTKAKRNEEVKRSEKEQENTKNKKRWKPESRNLEAVETDGKRKPEATEKTEALAM